MKNLNEQDLPKAISTYKIEALAQLVVLVRERIIETIAKKGGHLGASLGTVELSVALHHVFDTEIDQLVWDVGHQAYGHKLLTGRAQDFESIRDFDGLSGFLSRAESKYDSFGAGHSSTSISAAMGMALSQKFKNNGAQAVAIIGDASIVSGMAFEALNHLGDSKADVLVILNDNAMGIDPSVGALKDHFSKGSSSIKSFFESFKIEYSGPIDGHDLSLLLESLKAFKSLKGPRLLHLKTIKGKGLYAAEKDQVTYHAPGKFQPQTGQRFEIKKSFLKYQEIIGETLFELCNKASNVKIITPAMSTGSGLSKVLTEFPQQCFDVGIAEQHAVTLSAGLATQGDFVCCVIYSTFLQRAYDQIIHDVAIQKLPVVFCIDRAGLVGNDGPTHHGVFDIAYLSCIPNIEILSPANGQELQHLLFELKAAHEKGLLNHPVALRYPRGYSELKNLEGHLKIKSMRQNEWLKKGESVGIIASGSMHKIVDEFMAQRSDNERFSVFNLRVLKPLHSDEIITFLKAHQTVITLEDGVLKGGIGQSIKQLAFDQAYQGKIYCKGIEDDFVPHGTTSILFKNQNISVDALNVLVDQSS